MSDDLVEGLLAGYIYQKNRLLREAGAKGSVNQRRLAALARPRIERMAEVIRDWSVGPDVVMDAVFAWAKYNRHPDGPMPNMLHSVKYITQALSHYLQVPYAVVAEKRGLSLFLERMDFEFVRLQDELDGAGVTDLVTATSYPPEARYLMALQRMDTAAMFYIAQELLERMGKDSRVVTWLTHRGITYEAVARQFNNMKKQRQP